MNPNMLCSGVQLGKSDVTNGKLFPEHPFCGAFAAKSRDCFCQELFRSLCKLHDIRRQNSWKRAIGREKLVTEKRKNVVVEAKTGIH